MTAIALFLLCGRILPSATYALFGLPVVFFLKIHSCWVDIYLCAFGVRLRDCKFCDDSCFVYRPHWRNATFNCMVVVGLLLIALMVSRFLSGFDSATQIIDWNLILRLAWQLPSFSWRPSPRDWFLCIPGGSSHCPR